MDLPFDGKTEGTMQLMPMKLETYGVSDVGLVRQNNEDVWSEVPEANFFALADGMGGHRAGEVAARLAVMSVCKAIEERPDPRSSEDVKQALTEAIVNANRVVYSMGSQNEKLGGMGTTLCCLMLYKETAVYAHVGDSRIYRFRNKKLEQLTQDHSLRSELILKGELDEKSAAVFPFRNIITRAIGTTTCVEPETATAPLLPNDLYFLCSDGLTDAVTHEEILQVLESTLSVKEAAHKLTALAKTNGGSDNITIVLIKVI
jgi:protein phosphatase